MHTAPSLTDTQLSPAKSRHLPGHRRYKRRETRFAVNEVASLRSFNRLQPLETPAQLLDVSRTGIGISTTQALERGTRVQVRLKDVEVIGEVRYCMAVDDAFRSGILIESVIHQA